MMKLSGKTFLITGASRGIGAAICRELAQKGAALILVSRKEAPALIQELHELGAASVRSIALDLSQPHAAAALFAELQNTKSKIDVLINNAGLLTGGLLEEQDLADIRAMFQVNLVTLVELTRLLLTEMLKRKSGLIVNNASVSGELCLPCASTYAASKAGVVSFTRTLAQELKGSGVSTLLLLTPGVETEMYAQIPDLYGDHLKLEGMVAISAEKWAKSVVKAIEAGKAELAPSGATAGTLWLNRHAPKLFAKLVGTRFSRNPKK